MSKGCRWLAAGRVTWKRAISKASTAAINALPSASAPTSDCSAGRYSASHGQSDQIRHPLKGKVALPSSLS